MIIDANGKQIASYQKIGDAIILSDVAIVDAYKKDKQVSTEMRSLRDQVEELKTILLSISNKNI